MAGPARVRVRAAETRDLPRWAELRFELWPFGSVAEHVAELEVELVDPRIGSLIAEDVATGEVVGFASVGERAFANGCDTRPVAFLEGILVKASHRRAGVARLLVEAAAAWGKARGFRELGSDTEIEREASIAAHGAWGFEERERVVCFRKWIE